MSGEYFCVQEVDDASKFCHDFNNKGNDDSYSITSKVSQDVKLYEMEEQLEIAENRCNTLKDQLDQMKKLYQSKTESKKNVKHRTRKTVFSTISVSPTRHFTEKNLQTEQNDKREEEICTDGQRKTQLAEDSPQQNREDVQGKGDEEKENVLPVRQNSQAIGTDNSGAAVQTINNILTGITNSVNRLSELHLHLEKKSGPSSSKKRIFRDSACGEDEPILSAENIKCISKTTDIKISRNLSNLQEESQRNKSTDEMRVLSSSVLSTKSKSGQRKKSKKRNIAGKLQNSTITVNITNKKLIKSSAKHTEKKFKIEPVKMLGKDSNSILSPKKSKRQIKRPRQNSKASLDRRQFKLLNSNLETDKLVEIYHNTAAKGSETDSSNADENKKKRKEDKTTKIISATVTQCLANGPSQTFECKPPPETYNCSRMLSPINEHTYVEPSGPRIECCSTCSKNYELPTIVSKMKQVAKTYMRQFNLHSIPFCAAKSTSPSHNIGINIQQVMSIIKTRQPITGISPTLAHNIGLAAEKIYTKPLSAFVSSLGSRMSYGRSQCPLLKNNLNYQQLQEMAKEIPEETYDEMVAEEESKAVQNDSVNGASGDVNNVDHQSAMWTIDPANHKNCTCVPQHGIGFQHVLSRYQANAFSTSTISQMQNRIFRPRLSFTSKKIKQNVPRFNRSLESKPSGVLKGKEKNLKDVLMNLHEEFQTLNQHYESLYKKVSEVEGQADEETLKELEHLERNLNKKEEEITMVMALYKEVVFLKQQVKMLKEKASMASIAIGQQQQQYRYKDYNDPSAAIHLTKLLRQIQTYQEMNRVGRRN